MIDHQQILIALSPVHIWTQKQEFDQKHSHVCLLFALARMLLGVHHYISIQLFYYLFIIPMTTSKSVTHSLT